MSVQYVYSIRWNTLVKNVRRLKTSNNQPNLEIVHDQNIETPYALWRELDMVFSSELEFLKSISIEHQQDILAKR